MGVGFQIQNNSMMLHYCSCKAGAEEEVESVEAVLPLPVVEMVSGELKQNDLQVMEHFAASESQLQNKTNISLKVI